MKLLKTLLVFILLLVGFSGYAQFDGIKKFMSERKAKKAAKIEAGEPFLSILAGPGYTPDNGLLIGGGFLYTFKTNRSDSLIQRSSIPINTFISTKGNFQIGTALQSFWLEDKLRVNARLRYSNAEDNYFGVGIDNAENVPLGDSTTAYNRQYTVFNPTVLMRVKKDLYLGVGVDLNNTHVTSVNPLMAQDPDYLKYGPNNFNSGMLFSVNYDSRDVTVNAWKGWYAHLSTGFYGNYLGSNNTYQVYEYDVRSYFQIHRPGNILAFKFYGRITKGDIPYQELTALGGTNALRGYLIGQYRDKTGMYLVSEWRHTFLKRDDTLSKHGVTLWGGLGTIAPELSEIKRFVPNTGIGYRYEVQPRMNVRIDFGVGRHSTGLYFNFTEAF
ncbi:BamA/TamA family outer membrane protein [Formosa haliotis]|uniref:BamA/TamA family outer membrane protein n=1 Tax=Formosa haliotis TaxID=1555194 RepID=UPI000826A6E6|nr:BamA/TamA family outer membrane protein [Formosa haliotis]